MPTVGFCDADVASERPLVMGLINRDVRGDERGDERGLLSRSDEDGLVILTEGDPCDCSEPFFEDSCGKIVMATTLCSLCTHLRVSRSLSVGILIKHFPASFGKGKSNVLI